MKNTKNIFVSIVSAIALFSAPVSASNPPSRFEPIIEIYNKDNESVQFNLFQRKNPTMIKPERYIPSNRAEVIATTYLSPNQKWDSGSRVIDMNNIIIIEVLKQNRLVGVYHINAPGKTKYLSWSKEKKLYPQTGPLMGLLGKTESGFSLKNNVSRADGFPGVSIGKPMVR